VSILCYAFISSLFVLSRHVFGSEEISGVSISDVIQVLVVSASVAAVVIGIFAIIQGQIQAKEALAESRAQSFASQKIAQDAFTESRAQIIASQKIVQDALAQSRTQSLETLYALNRPILAPRMPLSLRNNDLDWDSQHYTVKVRNVGTGVALNVWGVLLPPKQAETVDPPRQYCLKSHAPISQEDKDIDTYFLEEKIFRGDEMIAHREGTTEQYSLCPPSVDLPQDSVDGRLGYVARLTLTYRDVFGRKHASIYDHTDRHRWKFVVHLDDIRNDLEDMHTSVLRKVNQQVIAESLEESPSEELSQMPTEELPSLGAAQA
jgi:hypothetical protein